MTDIEIVVFNDKSWVRLAEYQKLKEEFEKFKNGKVCNLCKYNTVGQDEYISVLEEQFEEAEQTIERMKICANCKWASKESTDESEGYYFRCRYGFTHREVSYNGICDNWELAE
jgi:hypothetical protein